VLKQNLWTIADSHFNSQINLENSNLRHSSQKALKSRWLLCSQQWS